MSSSIRIYLFPDSSKYIIKDNFKIMKSICKDTHTNIKYINRRFDSYFLIEGKFEDAHQARIILQDIEKNIYRDIYLDKSNIDNIEK